MAFPAAAQELPAPAPPDPDSLEAILDAPLPPLDLGDPVEAPEPIPPDPAVLAPLPPLATFDPTPIPGFEIAAITEDGIRYEVRLSGLQEIGLERPWRTLSLLWRERNRETTPSRLASRVRTDEDMTGRLLRSEGYYAGRAEGQVVQNPDGNARRQAIAEMNVVPGPRYSWSEIALEVVPPERPDLATSFLLSPGMPIRAADVEEAEGAHLIALANAGHPFAELGVRDVVLDDDEATGTYFLAGDPGPLAVIGEIRMTGFEPFSERHAARIARFSSGDIFSGEMVDDFRRAVIATQLFGGVTITPVDTGERTPEGHAVTDIRVSGQEGPLRRTVAQVGYGAGEGFRAEVGWLHRNFWPPEGALLLRGVAGTEEQSARAELIKSNFRRRDRILSIAANVANEQRLAFDAQSLRLAATLAYISTQLWQKPFTWSVGVELIGSFERDSGLAAFDDQGEEVPPPRELYYIGAIPAAVQWDRSDDLLNPTRGFRIGVRASPEFSARDGRTATYASLIADASVYREVRENLVLAARARLGTIIGASLLEIAPSRRLYAGGGGSVRGFEFQGIGPVGSLGRPLGGRGLVEGSVEARYRFGDFGVVAFVDGGQLVASSTPSLEGVRFGYGVGARYFTGIGPFRLDIARPFDRRPGEPHVAVYISIGQAF
ncbi:MAG: autotransporter assembly complex protein TamA [Thermaurantiacus sp.]